MKLEEISNLLSYQPILTSKIITIINALQEGSLTKEQFHNRKSYAKRKGDVVKVLEYTIAFEIASMLEKEDVDTERL